jgi:hypothetical protein
MHPMLRDKLTLMLLRLQESNVLDSLMKVQLLLLPMDFSERLILTTKSQEELFLLTLVIVNLLALLLSS